MDGDDNQLMYIPDEIDTSGLRLKSASMGFDYHLTWIILSFSIAI